MSRPRICRAEGPGDKRAIEQEYDERCGDGDLLGGDAEQARQIKASFMNAVKGSREPMVLGSGLSYSPLMVDPNDSQFIDLMRPLGLVEVSRTGIAAMARGEAYNFPVVREALGEGRQYGFKSGLDRSGQMLGVKAGGYFPGNAAKGIINHQSTVFLFDPDTGREVLLANTAEALAAACLEAAKPHFSGCYGKASGTAPAEQHGRGCEQGWV